MCCTFVTWPAVHWNRLDSATWCDLSDQESIPKLVETRAASRSQAAVERTALSGAVMPSSF